MNAKAYLIDSCARVYHTEAGIATGGFVGPFTPAMRAEASQGHKQVGRKPGQPGDLIIVLHEQVPPAFCVRRRCNFLQDAHVGLGRCISPYLQRVALR